MTPLLGYKLYEVMMEAGIPSGVFNFVTGGGSTAGQALIDSPDIAGIVFTGSKDVGMHLIRDNASRAVPRPLIIEMGGKNPALVMKSANLDMATAVRNTVRHLGVPVEEALRMAALYPAQFLRLDDELGRIATGYRADLVLLDANFQVKSTWISGQRQDEK